ncbi:hypothetical protein [Pelomonas sp. Root1444]|uniref:hypothetical protein n=1 Tax=Pelomonas sp. Root1444 TaxID=1736464 RepID=UPI0012FB7999|nr:hypothetical protein [Pelomonas sp. Root1444]
MLAYVPPSAMAEAATWNTSNFYPNALKKKISILLWPSQRKMEVRLNGRIYTLTSRAGSDTEYKLDTISSRGVVAYTYNRDAARRLQSITNAFGATVQFGWSSDGSRVTSVTAPSGLVWNYSYNNGVLAAVTPPQPSAGIYTYFYENSTNAAWLTGYAIDGVRATRYIYDAQGRVVNSAALDGTFSDNFSYSDNATVQTDVRGQVSTHNFSVVNGHKQWVSTNTAGTPSLLPSRCRFTIQTVM